MHQSETYDFTHCLHCGADVSVARDRAYAVSEHEALCYGCALARGGEYDEIHDRWTRAPNVAGLPIELAGRSRIWR